MKSLSGLQIEYQVQLDSDVCRCSCGYEKDMRSPCTHVLHCLRHENRLGDAFAMFDNVWKSTIFSAAYGNDNLTSFPPAIVIDSLVQGTCSVPTITKRRGRP
ncbi:Zinc finger, SWIM-type [Plasmopara halstedii]|uniref:Zinc finger, SWIM-type n=1 Tax=Plasmopara halstedii TaxID=4781 RepID=A0A0P1AE10_PLAHL|nr:Zinc finger, SWIM-type [Plasmopara halstedii]CEG38616.1 Zinc finger, SWIM-type [Plasmopara halstedii]|eukprot:XP_024574985.1 Zinc finger, SWIM-type [Plasmopara halstedii]